ncbi:Aminodeoxychorismate lyase [Fusarium irregulare]|uniref:Aminodeoxychorismate lyase n=1 Tax=Fusarium irregulare TaxID=2494466 RepID=A0A9W8UEG9_9HYPO|nr:Aminodeoxychorismate lyase [Fusarium irregulare]KAJ4028592.1 Aminodeoxychorismate lyase [Fusarium irregulare]
MTDDFSLFTSMRYDPQLEQVGGTYGLSGKGWNFENESPLYMLDFHRDRLLKAASHWKWHPAIDRLSGDDGLSSLAQLILDNVETSQRMPLKIKLVMSRHGNIEVEQVKTSEVPLQNLFPARLPEPSRPSHDGEPQRTTTFNLLVDQAATKRSEYTHFKTTKRPMYDAARQRAGITYADPAEVLIVNQDDESVMEGTFTTPYFWRDGRWVTPPVAAHFSWDQGSGGQDGTSRRWALERGLVSEQEINVDSLTHGEECWISNGVRGFIAATVRLLG